MTLAILYRNFGREEETARLFNIVANEIIRNGTVAENMGILAIIANAFYFGHGVPVNESFAIGIFKNIIDNGLKDLKRYANNNYFIRSLVTLNYIIEKNDKNNKPLSILNKLHKEKLINKKKLKEIVKRTFKNLRILDEMKKEKISKQIKNQQDIQQKEKEELERKKREFEEYRKRKEEEKRKRIEDEKLKQQQKREKEIEKLKQQVVSIQEKRKHNEQVINHLNHSIEQNNIEMSRIKETISDLEKQIADTQEQIKSTAISMAQKSNLTTDEDYENSFPKLTINRQQTINVINGSYIMEKIDSSGNKEEIDKLGSLFFEKNEQDAHLKFEYEQNQSRLKVLYNENERLKAQLGEAKELDENLTEKEKKVQISLQKFNS